MIFYKPLFISSPHVLIHPPLQKMVYAPKNLDIIYIAFFEKRVNIDRNRH